MINLEPINTLRRLPLTVDDYLLLDSNGAFDGYGKTELIDGEIYFMNAQYRPHVMAKTKFHNALHSALVELNSSLCSVVEGTVALALNDAPEPDVILTSEPDGEGSIPVDSVALLIEISDTTLKIDLGKKLQRYASAKIPEYWVFDIDQGVLHQMWSPAYDAYTQSRVISKGSAVHAETINDLSIFVPI